MESSNPNSDDGSPSGKYVPRFRREGNTAVPAKMSSDYQTPAAKLGMALARLGFQEGANANWYYPLAHPHIHVGQGSGGWFMAFSDGQQHRNGGGRAMAGRRGKLQHYTWGKDQLLKRRRDDGLALTKEEIDHAVDNAYEEIRNMR